MKEEPAAPMMREVTIKSRRTGYNHKPIVVYSEHALMTESGELIEDVATWIMEAEPHLVVTQQVPWLIDLLLEMDHPNLQIRLSDSRPDVKGSTTSKPKIVSFGRKPIEGKRNKGQHIVLDVQKLFSESKGNSPDRDFGRLLSVGSDVRSFCKEQDIPIKVSPAGIAGALSTDKRFAPSGQYQVPRKINEGVREFLPGVRHTSHVPVRKLFKRATALDQRKAYHRAAQRIILPSPQYLYARGHYASYKERPDKLWIAPHHKHFKTVLRQHGLFILNVTQGIKPDEFAPRICHVAYADQSSNGAQVAAWSNELEYARQCGLRVDGVYASFTSPEADTVLPQYAAFAESTINSAAPERSQWLKPTLHARWGLLGSRSRRLFMASKIGKGKPAIWRIGMREIPVQEAALPAFAPRTANVPALGMLQAEIEITTLGMAIALKRMGFTVLHTHADGLHMVDAQLPLLGPNWTASPMTNLMYENDVSWTSNERDVLPGLNDGRRKEALRRAAARKHSYVPDITREPRGMFD